MTSPALALAAGEVLYLPARIRHTRLGALRHAFSYRADYLLFAPERMGKTPALLRKNRFGVFSLHEGDHGGQQGQGAPWAWAEFAKRGIVRDGTMVLGLLTQPRFFGFGFNPVSFWLLWQEGHLIGVIAEVTNTWRQRHSYLCHLQGQPIPASMPFQVSKALHVSPFQDIGGDYRFRFGLSGEGVDILITHHGPKAGLVARMQGALQPLQGAHLWRALALRPGGALRVVGLIYLHALRLKLRGAAWRPLPPPPSQEISE